MKCPVCGAAELIHDTRDMPYTYKGASTVIEAVTGDFCPACDEAVLDVAESTRTSELMLQFNKEINAVLRRPDVIARMQEMGLVATPMSLAETRQFLTSEAKIWGEATRKSNATVD